MKKALVLMLTLLFCAACIHVWAEEPERETHESGDFEYVLLDNGTMEIIGYLGDAKSLDIPDELDGISVTVIGNNAFYNCSSLASVTIPNSVIAIEDWAFSCCYSLTSVTIPNSLATIGSNPFESCTKLSDIRITPNHPVLTTIDGVLFSKADQRLICYPGGFSQSEYKVPQGIVTIGNSAFFGCDSLTSVTLPDSLTAIDDYAFSYCSSLTAVTLPDSLTAIGDSAFYLCDSLNSVILPNSLTTIGNCAFSWCDSLTTLALPNNLITIDDFAFYGCSSLTSVTLPDSLAAIDNWAFKGCDKAIFTVGCDSYAKQYCIDNNLPYTYPNANDWLNN